MIHDTVDGTFTREKFRELREAEEKRIAAEQRAKEEEARRAAEERAREKQRQRGKFNAELKAQELVARRQYRQQRTLNSVEALQDMRLTSLSMLNNSAMAFKATQAAQAEMAARPEPEPKRGYLEGEFLEIYNRVIGDGQT